MSTIRSSLNIMSICTNDPTPIVRCIRKVNENINIKAQTDMTNKIQIFTSEI